MPKNTWIKYCSIKKIISLFLKYPSIHLYYKRAYIPLKYIRIEIRIEYNSYKSYLQNNKIIKNIVLIMNLLNLKIDVKFTSYWC
jgi:hypothetical protein